MTAGLPLGWTEPPRGFPDATRVFGWRRAVVRQRYELHGIRIDLIGEPAVLARIDGVLEHPGFVAAEDCSGTGEIVLRCSADAGTVKVPPEARMIVEEGPVRVQSSDGALYVGGPGHACRLDLAGGAAEVVVPPLPARPRKDVLLLALLLLLRRRGLYGLHASGVARNGTGCLFVAPSGSGKSTQTYSLVRQGWAYLGDDSLLLRDQGEHVAALALRRHLCLDPVLVHAFPEVATHGKAGPFASRGKRRLSMRTLYPGQLIDACVPRVLVFPEIVAAPASRLVPLEPAGALLRLMNESLAMVLDPDTRHTHLRLLGRLVSQAQSWRLLAGRDLKAQPELVGALLERACPSLASPAPRSTR